MSEFKDCLCKIRDLQHRISEFEQQLESRFGISLNEGMVLCSLSSTGCLTCGNIANMMTITSSNCSKVVSKVEAKGLIFRTLGKEDKREMIFELTPAGKELIDRINASDISFGKLPL